MRTVIKDYFCFIVTLRIIFKFVQNCNAMKSTREIFKENPSLLQEPEVIELLEYCEELEAEIIEFKFEKSNNKELAMIDMLQEVIKGCNDLEKEQMEHERFGYEPPDYQETVSNLKSYIQEICRINKIWL